MVARPGCCWSTARWNWSKHTCRPSAGRPASEGCSRRCTPLSSEGIVWCQDAVVGLDELDVYADGARRGLLTCRINAAFKADPVTWTCSDPGFSKRDRPLVADDSASRLVDREHRQVLRRWCDRGRDRISARAIRERSPTCGLPNWTAEGLKEAVRTFDADGFQIHIHAIGDAGVRMALDAIEHAARAEWPPRSAAGDRPHPTRPSPGSAAVRVARRDRQLRAAVGLPRCLAGRPDLPCLGPQRSRCSIPSPRLRRLGARVSFGSDWPVSSHRPLDGLAVAVTRRTPRVSRSMAGSPRSGSRSCRRSRLYRR